MNTSAGFVEIGLILLDKLVVIFNFLSDFNFYY